MDHKGLIISLLLLSGIIEFKTVFLLKKCTSSESDRPHITLLITAITYATLAHRGFDPVAKLVTLLQEGIFGKMFRFVIFGLKFSFLISVSFCLRARVKCKKRNCV